MTRTEIEAMVVERAAAGKAGRLVNRYLAGGLEQVDKSDSHKVFRTLQSLRLMQLVLLPNIQPSVSAVVETEAPEHISLHTAESRLHPDRCHRCLFALECSRFPFLFGMVLTMMTPSCCLLMERSQNDSNTLRTTSKLLVAQHV